MFELTAGLLSAAAKVWSSIFAVIHKIYTEALGAGAMSWILSPLFSRRCAVWVSVHANRFGAC